MLRVWRWWCEVGVLVSGHWCWDVGGVMLGC